LASSGLLFSFKICARTQGITSLSLRVLSLLGLQARQQCYSESFDERKYRDLRSLGG
jgi:hypothetical protein